MTGAEPGSARLLKLARDFQTKKQLGQHFLVNARVLQEIVDSLEIGPDDEILEIGPGIGFLTRLLCKQAKHVTAVDLDRESVAYLKSLKLENLSIKHGDILAYDIASGRFKQGTEKLWEPKAGMEADARKIKVVGNLPYQITGLILAYLLGEIGEPAPYLDRIECIVLTVQKEVAKRMVARPASRDYAQLSLLISYYCSAEIILELPPNDFYPAPKVESAVLKMTPLSKAERNENCNCKNHKLLRRVIKAGFAQRRKVLPNALLSLGFSHEELKQAFQKLQFDPAARAEQFSLKQFAMLTDLLELQRAGRQDSESIQDSESS